MSVDQKQTLRTRFLLTLLCTHGYTHTDRNVCAALRFEMLRCGYAWEYAMDSQWTIIATWLVHLHQLAPATYSCRSGCLEGAWHAGRMISARIWTHHR